MAGFENSLRAASLAILKRELTESKRVEFLELAAAIGMGSVEDYLYMLMVFKRNEDRVNGVIAGFRNGMEARFDEMGALEQKIHDTLESSISRVLGDETREIGRDMAGHIAEKAKGVLAASEDFHFLRDRYIFPAVFSYAGDGITVTFPDLPGCVSCGGTDEEAVRMAEEALGLHLSSMGDDGETIPSPSVGNNITLAPNERIFLVDVWMPKARQEAKPVFVKKR
jgi:predicted RNase H-like HicB family nuclease